MTREERDRPVTAIPDAPEQPRDLQELMTPREVADLLGIDVATVSLWRAIGVLPEGSSPWRFRRADVLTFLARRSHRAGSTGERRVVGRPASARPVGLA